MAIDIEQFTAPGKYYYDLAMEKLEVELKNKSKLYIGLRNEPSESTFKNNPYYGYTSRFKKK